VAIFRDPHDGMWKVLDYERIVTLPNAHSPEDVVRQYFDQGGTSVLYKINDPNQRPIGLEHIKSDRVAIGDAFVSAPGLPAGLLGNYGLNRGLNDTLGVGLPQPGNAGMSFAGGLNGGSATLTTDGGTRVEAGARSDSASTTAGVSVLTPTGAHSAAGGKIIFHENEGGPSLTVAGETWRINGGNYFGVVAGADTHIEVLDRFGNQLTTVAPFVAVSGGMTHRIVDGQVFTAEAFWNASARVEVPLVVNGADRARVDSATNGMSAGGWIDPGGLASHSGVDTNGGMRARIRLADGLTLDSTIAAHTVLTDPTLAPTGTMYLPFRGSVDGSLALNYTSPGFSGRVGALGTVGSVYDRDPRWEAFATGNARLSDKASIQFSAIGGAYVSGQNFADVRAGLTYSPTPSVTVGVGGGASIFHSDGGPTEVVPNAGGTLTWRF
jgi:hypothetical protein